MMMVGIGMASLFSFALALRGGVGLPHAPAIESGDDAIAGEVAADEDDATAMPAELTAWASSLAPLALANVNTGAAATIRLYANDGALDPFSVAEFTRVVSPSGELHDVSPRLMQLVVKAAYHFHVPTIAAISGYRPEAKAPKPGQKGSRHATGEALDFRLPGVTPAVLASFLRSYARAGVGIYTHPRTQYVHLDVRDESYHWVDASPPRISWRERGLPDPKRSERDAAWVPELDLPLDLE